MGENNFIENIQSAFSQQADANAAKGNSTNKPAPAKKDEAPAGNGQPNKEEAPKPDSQSSSNFSLSAYLKEKHGVDMSDDDILARVKGDQKPADSSSGSARPARKAPVKEDIQDSDVDAFLKQNNREGVLTRHAERSKQGDIDIVKATYRAEMKELHKDMTDEDIDARFNEQYFISEDDTYSKEEKAWGQHLIKKEAARMRGSDEMVINAARDIVFSQRLAEYQKAQYDEQVDQFMSQAPKSIPIELGKSGNKDLGTFDFELSADALTEIGEIMKNPAMLANEFKDDKGEVDQTKLFNLLVNVKLGATIQKSLASHFHSQGVEEVENRLNHNPDLENVGGKPSGASKTELQKKADEHNRSQIEANTGMQPKRRERAA